MRRAPLMLLLLTLGAGAHAQDLLGQRFSPDTFALCRTYGCRVLSREAGLVRLQLLRQDARVTLSLSPHGTVMGLEAWITAPRLSDAQGRFLHALAERAAEQSLDLNRLRRCWPAAQPGEPRRVLGGGGEHYAVACLRQAGRLNHWGVRVAFDH